MFPLCAADISDGTSITIGLLVIILGAVVYVAVRAGSLCASFDTLKEDFKGHRREFIEHTEDDRAAHARVAKNEFRLDALENRAEHRRYPSGGNHAHGE